MNEFITYEMLSDFVKLTSITLAVTQFTKNAPVIRGIKTQYWAWFVAFVLIIATNVNMDSFEWMDILLYGLSAMFVSTSANGIYAVGEKSAKTTDNEAITGENDLDNKE